MRKYGLNLRRPQQKKQPAARPPDETNDVEKEISRHASKNKSLKDVEEQQRKAVEEDSLVFDYDGAYDEDKQKAIQPRARDREERRPKYIGLLMDKAEERKRELEIANERRLDKLRSKEDHLYAGKDKYVTSGYNRKKAEREKWMEEERLREEKDDVAKEKDLTDFYFNLGKNVAFGAADNNVNPRRKVEKQAELAKPEKVHEEGTSSGMSESSVELCNEKTASKTASSGQEILPVEQQPLGNQPKSNIHHKRSEGDLAAAKERYLARKRAKLEQ